jgi:ABC-type transporter Mla subunit MlaD
MVRRIGDHLEGQTQRTERLLELMDRLPPAIDALPEINRQNARFVETLHEHFGQAKRREEALNETLSTLTEASGRQTDVLGLVQQHLDTSGQMAAQLGGTLDTLRETLGDMADANARTVDVLSSFTEKAAMRETELITTITRTQRWMIGASVFCGMASVTAIVVALLAFLG